MKAFLAFLFAIGSTSVFANSIVSPFLIRGIELKSTELPEVVRIKAGTSRCTAMIVGPDVVLTAAHCVRSSRVASFLFEGEKYIAVFESHPDYGDGGNDLALGITTEEISGAIPLSIGENPVKGEKALLAGYGCTEKDRTGGNDGILRANWAKYMGKYSDLLRFEDEIGAAGCSGDSGGPAFSYIDKELVLAGVHSKADMNKRTLSTSLTDEDSLLFLQAFAEENEVTICGLNKICNPHLLPKGL